MMDIAGLQTRVGATRDGVLGPVTVAKLFQAVGAPVAIAAELGLSGAVHMVAAGLFDAPLRLAHFLAQAGHETDGFRTMEEYASGKAYEGRADLGNLTPGDGVRYKGRGAFQVTGRANYRSYGRTMGLDLESHPELAAVPSIGLWVACLYWTNRRLNDFADRDDVEAVTRRVNGGTNGLADRMSRLTLAKRLVL